ncbi:MAG: GDSL-type esterase/lipase family protein [candidate division KSB1 bacterium]|nr:GDSL-type esterase/lipase family protein [candidate division KSB1 bacterium]MDZ7400950.1 GDSL-type esterase/lipase family protein [candidate division KSB1 bacterium]
MPLGDSITHGEHGSTPIGGFRDDLADLLLREGVNFDLVGTLNDGTGSNYPYHEGHPGKTAEYLANNILTWLSATNPNIVLLHIGTNDINSYYSNTDIRDDIERILENIWSFDSKIPVLLCSLIPRNDNLNNTNTALCELVHELAVKKLMQGKLIRYVGQNEVWVVNSNWPTAYLYDKFHPNNSGYNVMAEVYFNVLMNQLTSFSQFITDNFDRTNLGMTWNSENAYKIISNQLTIQSGGNFWWKPAIYVAEMDPISVSFDWARSVDSTKDGNAGLALHLQSNQINTNGYLVYKESATRKLKLYRLQNGAVAELLSEVSGKLPPAKQGDQFRVAMYSDFQGAHFTCYINGDFDGDVIDRNSSYSTGKNHFAGVMLAGTANNVVDNFQLIHSKGAAERIYAIWGDQQQGDPGERLPDSLVAMVTDQNGNPIPAIPVSFEVIEGTATIAPPESQNHFEFEAENGVLTYPMQVMNDPNASNGKYVEVPAEYPDDSNAKVVFTFTVAEEADFVVWGRVQSGDHLHDSFKVIMDEQPEIVWHISGKYTWTWDQVYVLNGEDPKIFHLTAGTHTLGIKNREWGSKLDKIIITNNLSFNPATLQKPQQYYYITNSSGRAHAIVTLGATPGLVKIKASSPNFSDHIVFTATIRSDKVPASLAIVSGNNQSAKPNETLPNPLVVEVRDAQAQLLPNIAVKFEIVQGTGASLGSPQPVMTNSQGQAATTLKLGSEYGTYLVRASCPGYTISPVTFQATATSAVLAISGSCNYYNGNTPINNVVVRATGNANTSAITNTQGQYQLTGLEMHSNYTLTPERVIFNDWSSHLITTYQAALTLRQAVGLENFSSLQVKAADVDRDGKVTAYDAALIAQFAVGLPRRSDSHVGEWQFIPGFRSYYDLTTSYQNQDYTGILLGDVTGKWNQSYNAPKPAVELPPAWLEEISVHGDRLVIPISIPQEVAVLSWQLQLRYDPSKLRYIKVDCIHTDFHLVQNLSHGMIEVGMYGVQPIHSSEPFATLVFQAIDDKSQSFAIEVPYFQINDQIHQQGNTAIAVQTSEPKAFVLLNNYPNPFNPSTTIVYQIPETGWVSLKIYNLAGQQIVQLVDEEQTPGIHQVEWNGLDQNGHEAVAGIYFGQLRYRNQHKTIRLVKIK